VNLLKSLQARADAEKKDGGKDDKMEELLRRVDAGFLAMIKEAEDDESNTNNTNSSNNNNSSSSRNNNNHAHSPDDSESADA
jgi:hypothetical protein